MKSLALVAGAHGRGAGAPMQQPRIGLFRPWSGSMDEGWTRWVLEQYGFDVVDAASRPTFKSPLADKVDVVILADDARLPIEAGRRRAAAAAAARRPGRRGPARVRGSTDRRGSRARSSSSSAAAARSSA